MPEKPVADSGSHGQTNNHRFWKWVSGILTVVVVAEGGLLVKTDRQIVALDTKQVAMGIAVSANAQWIRDWSTVLRVPERDQKQDSNIEELKRRLFVLEKHYIEMMEKMQDKP